MIANQQFEYTDDIPGVLAQLDVPGAAEQNLFVVPVSSRARILGITVCNRNAYTTSFRLNIAIKAAATDPKQYLYYDLPVPAHDNFMATFRVTLNAADVVRVYAGTSGLSVTLYGEQT